MVWKANSLFYYFLLFLQLHTYLSKYGYYNSSEVIQHYLISLYILFVGNVDIHLSPELCLSHCGKLIEK